MTRPAPLPTRRLAMGRTRHSYARLAVADAVGALGIVSVLCAAAGALDDAGDAALLAGFGLVAAAGGISARSVLVRPRRPAPGRVLGGLALSWLILVVLGTGIYLVTGTITRVDDAFVESAAGFSTTSVTTLDPSGLSTPMQLWRAGTQWVGGLLGIVVGAIALPMALRGDAIESGRRHALDRLAPTVDRGRRRITMLYTAFTAIVAVAYRLVGMGTLDSVVHALTTVSTGGFSSRVDSFASFGTGPRIVATIAMIIAGTSLVVVWWAIRGRTRSIVQSTELRVYAIVLVAGSALVATAAGIGRGDAVFTVVSAVTTTGYAVGDWTVLAPWVLMVLLAMVGTGAMSASAAGGLKLIRAWMLIRFAGRELRSQLDPASVVVVKQAGATVPERALESTTGYQIAHFGVATFGVFVLATTGQELTASLFDAVSAMSSFGPGLGTGAYGRLDGYSPAGRMALTPFMMAGRLSILPLMLAVSMLFRAENEVARRVRRLLRSGPRR